MDRHIDPLTQKLLHAIRHFHKAGWHQKTIAGYKASEIRILFCIEQLAASETSLTTKVSEISKLLQVTSPTVTQLIKGLETQGLVERHINPTDRRAVDIKLTEQGKKVSRQAADFFISSLEGLIAHLGEAQSDQLADLLNKATLYYKEQQENVHEFPTFTN